MRIWQPLLMMGTLTGGGWLTGSSDALRAPGSISCSQDRGQQPKPSYWKRCLSTTSRSNCSRDLDGEGEDEKVGAALGPGNVFGRGPILTTSPGTTIG